MRRSLLLILTLLLPVFAGAQDDDKNPAILAMIRENPSRAGNNTAPYEFLPAAETPVPRGYKPFYISHYGRHGSRSNWAGSTYGRMQQFFAKAAEEGILTAAGDSVRSEIEAIILNHNGMDGRLTYRGTREHRAIAARMYNKYKGVFRHGKVSAVGSNSRRCLVSMAAFTGELLAHRPQLDIHWDNGDVYMPYISTDDGPEISKKAHAILAAHREAFPPDTAAFYRRIFSDPGKARRLEPDVYRLMLECFDMGRIAASFDLDDCIFHYLGEDAVYHYSENLSMNLYLRQCNSLDFGDERMKKEGPILRDLIDKADAAIRTGEYCADLRFGHDYQLLAYAARLGVEGVGERLTAEQCRRNWFGFLYSPFAGNLQLIFYRGRKGDVLVKCYINEREARLIGLPGGPYYPWEDVKKMLMQYL